MVALRGKKQIKLTRRQPILMPSYEFCSCVMSTTQCSTLTGYGGTQGCKYMVVGLMGFEDISLNHLLEGA